ncbi:MAG: amidohydrolase [Myxococcota bacterium]
MIGADRCLGACTVFWLGMLGTSCGLRTAAIVPSAESSGQIELPALPWQLEEELPLAYSSRAVALAHGTMMSGVGTIADSLIVMRDGRIAYAGPFDSERLQNELGPEGSLIDIRGLYVTPGLIDTHSHMGVYAMPQVRAHADGNEATSPTTPGVYAGDSFWPQDPALSRALAAGVTTVHILPGSANLIGGRGVTIKLQPGTSLESMRFVGAPYSLKMACGENPKRVYGQRHQPPSTRMGSVLSTRNAFQDALEYRQKFLDWQQKHRSGPEHVDPAPSPPTRDFGLETLLQAIEGAILVQVHCYRADEMLRMLDLADEFGFRVRAFHHAVEAYKIREVLASRHVGVSTWFDWWGFKAEAYDAIFETLPLLSEARVRAALHSDDAMLVQRLNQEVAKAMTAGRIADIEVDREAAMRWITADAAWILGIEHLVGTLEEGKMADVTVWNADPFSVYASVTQVYVDGALAYAASEGRRPSDFELGQPGTKIQ